MAAAALFPAWLEFLSTIRAKGSARFFWRARRGQDARGRATHGAVCRAL